VLPVDLMQNEPAIRLTVFFGVFAAVAIWEVITPFRDLATRKPIRWARNLGLLVVDTLLVRLVLPAGAVGASLLAIERGWGLFNVVSVSPAVAIIASVVILDFTIYLQHVVFHAMPALWRLHMVHHADLDFDVTTGTRFHPLEILLSMLIKIAVVVVLGAPALAVLIFELLLNATAMFNHGNVSLPRWLDTPVRWLVVTPDMHRVHHSVKRVECNSNFGFNLPWWDRLFGTYVPEPAAGRDDMVLGVSHIRDERQTVPWLIGLPFLRRTGVYPFGRGKQDRSGD
jgi:sterol desaturase/sphingolipid hydroxylase (fatty acid hydroxylase superfamily)